MVVSFLIVLICLEKFDSLLYFLQYLVNFFRIFDCLLMIENVGTLVLVFVVLLMLFNLTHDTSQHVLSIQNHHARLLEVSRAGDYHRFIDLDLPQIVSISLQKVFLV